MSLPFPEPGIRLIRQDAIDAFNHQLTEFKAELDEAVAQLDEQYLSLQAAARERLGSLDNANDYPVSLFVQDTQLVRQVCSWAHVAFADDSVADMDVSEGDYLTNVHVQHHVPRDQLRRPTATSYRYEDELPNDWYDIWEEYIEGDEVREGTTA